MTKKKRPRPIAPKPIQMKSRKKARQITSLFHKLTRQIEHEKLNLEKDGNGNNNNNSKGLHVKRQAKIEALEQEIEKMGGREEYQRASQLSTKFHSTSKWVLKVLFQYGWLPNGIPIVNDGDDGDDGGNDCRKNDKHTGHDHKKDYRTVHILEIGAINVELLNAASKTKRIAMKKSEITEQEEEENIKNENEKKNGEKEEERQQKETNTNTAITRYKNVPLNNLHVRAIDIRSSHESIEEADYLSLSPPLSSPNNNNSNNSNKNKSYYDVIVCSMVLNCVTTATDRGHMISKMYSELNDGGLCFLTIPKLCLTQSKYINKEIFEKILVLGVGFEIVNQKETPKVAFWVLKKKEKEKQMREWKKEWNSLRVIHRGKKYRNEFGVVLSKDNCC